MIVSSSDLRESHDGAADFICARFSADDPVLAVRVAVARLAESRNPQLPVSLENILGRCRVYRRICSLPHGREAMLVPVAGGFELRVPHGTPHVPYPLLERERRFTLAHEIMEQFFFSDESDPPTHWSRLPPYRAHVRKAHLRSGGTEERLCDYGAGLMLIPMAIMEGLTRGGSALPVYSELLRASRACDVGVLNMTHRMACYLALKQRSRVVIAITRKCANPSSRDPAVVQWRLCPTDVSGGHPVGIDIRTTLDHRFYLATNRSLRGIGFDRLPAWLDTGAEQRRAPLGECPVLRRGTSSVGLALREATFDREEATALLWLTPEFGA
jgi:hypothetical protein